VSRPLAQATTVDGVVVAGTRDALRIGELTIPWEQVQSADWDKEGGALVVAEVGHWGDERPVHRLPLPEPGRLLQLVRERVTASVVLQRHVAVDGRRGLFVIGRRSPSGHGPITWIFEFQDGIDPADPAVQHLAEAALQSARADVGDS
jgi:hypothetical protein